MDVSVPAAEAIEDLLARMDPIVDERTEDEQNAKLRLVETLARYYWGNEI